MPSSSIPSLPARAHAAPWDAARLALLAAAAAATLFLALVAHLPVDGTPAPLDVALAALVAPLRTGSAAALFSWITVAGSGAVVIATGALASLWLLLVRKARLVAVLWWTLAGAAACTWLAKLAVARPRPGILPGFAAWSPSFPSSHASAAVAYVFIAYVLTRDARGSTRLAGGAAVTALVAMVAASRIVLGLHHATDVLGGVLLASTWAFLGIAVAERQRSVPRGVGAAHAAFA